MASIRQEILVDASPEHVWAAVGGQFTHHNASVQVFAEGADRSRLVWIADLLPHDIKAIVSGLIEQALTVMKQTLERSTAG